MRQPGGITDFSEGQGARLAWMNAAGFYEREMSNPNGMLVGYAGTYSDSKLEKKHYVGDVYYNFAPVEADPEVLPLFAHLLADHMMDYLVDDDVNPLDAVLGVAMGSVRLSGLVGINAGVYSPYAEKLTLKPSDAGQRAEEILVLDRHSVEKGWKVAICEDVLNNFSTTGKLIQLVEEAGATVVAIVAAMNRSADGRVWYEHNGVQIPILTVLHNPTQQYRQDDPYVADLIAAGRVVWKPKFEWEKLATT